MGLQFLFGRVVMPAKPVADGPRPLFILGAYPSALHVRWHVPGQRQPVQAVAVDNEPEPFWTSHDEAQRIDQWRKAVAFRTEWGTVEPCSALNGSSGAWVETKILKALGATRASAWITDCLDTYHESTGAAARLDSAAIAAVVQKLGIPQRSHQAHPTEAEIVTQAVGGQKQRLLNEVLVACPARIVTLGNAALRVLNALVEDGAQIQKLSADDSYGRPLRVRVCGRDIEWFPLAHPAAPAVYQEAHCSWMEHALL